MTVYHDIIQGIFARLQNLGRICASQYDWNAIAAADSAAV